MAPYLIPYRPYRVVINLLARSMRALMRAREIPGTFCIGAEDAFYEWQGMRFAYSYKKFGVAGDMDAGGTSEESTRNKLNEFLDHQSVFYDIGAHEGLFSISAKKHIPKLIVHAFEPQPGTLQKNLILNDLRDVEVHAAAVGDREGSISMTTHHRSSNYVIEQSGTIPMIMLDRQNIPPPTVIKLDIEGFEFHALRGAREILNKHHPVIVTEINHCFLRYNADLTSFYDFMNSIGYRMFALRAGKLIELNQNAKLPDDLTGSDDSNYWWLTGNH
jgi:FkbM family methyltransferase